MNCSSEEPGGSGGGLPTGCVMSRLSASGAHRSSLWRRLRPRENAATLLRGARAAALALAALAVLAVGMPEYATAQTEVPADWALKPADIGAGEQFRLMFVTSTTRDATSTAITDYNTFVSTRALAGVTAMQAYANDFTALVSTQAVNARANTLTRATDTDAPIYWVRAGTVNASNRAADDYADFYDGTWQNSSSGRTESGNLYGFFSGRLWTGTNTNGTTHGTQFMGASASTIRWRIQSGSITTDGGAPSRSQNIVALSPVFQVAGGTTSSDATLSALALADASDDAAITISPVFASGTTSYTASVDNDVDEITVAPTVNESNATVEYLDSTDTAITDANSGKTGQQVSLDVGANTIKVKVTAQDATTDTYTVVVTRAAAPMQTVVTFISNSAQRSSDFSRAANATAFTTGGNSGGYELSSVDIYLPLGGAAGETPKVEIFEDSAGDPGTLHATLNNPSSFHDFANTFNAPRNTTLRASTTYWLVSSNSAETTGQGFPVLTGNATADTGSTAGWSIGNARSKSDIRSTLWNSTSARIIFAVKGTVAGSAVTNAAAVGAPTITGAAQVGRTLTAVTTGITDADGLTSSTYTYQWIRVDGTDADIAGANSSTYTLDDADLDKTIRVEVSFTDDQGNSETLISRVYPTSGTVQANNALVSNVGQTTTNAFPLQLSDLAQSFMTGANATGYTLASIELKLDSSDSTATPAVKLYSGSANGTAEATTFTGPPMLDAASSKNYAFTPTSTVTLLGSTTYWVVAEATTDVKWNVTGVSEDTITPATGWSIANNYEFRNANTTGSFTTDPAAEVLQIRVNGTLGGIVLSSDATLSALALEDAADDSAIIISPVFASGTTSYTASVDNDVDEITVEPTVNESNATVEYLDSTDTAIADANSGKTGQQVSLDVGANTIKVKVTAQDATTDTYTVVVTRALAMQTVVTFISNSAQLDANSSSIFIRATAFTTGGNSAGYELSSVDIYVPYFVSSSTIPRVEIYEDSGSDPGTLHATLNNPSSYQPSANTFNAPRNTTLRAGTTYWLVTSNSAAANGQNFLVSTGSATADTGSDAGWSIGNARSKTIITDTLWTLTTDRIIFAVKGTATGGTATNTAAAGAPTITGTAQVGQTLTAVTTGIMDADGLTSPTYTYQWIRVNGTEADIAGANSSTYTLDDADLDKTIRVRVSFDDDDGNSETLISRVYPTSGTVQANNALVSNLGQSRTNAFRLALSDLAQAFTTGANPAGYTLSSIDLKLDSSDSTNTPTVKLYSGSANGMEEAAFTGPAMLDASTVKNYAFAPSSTVILLGSTTYWVVAEGAVRWVLGGAGEDATPAMGWSIANNYEYRVATLSTGGFTTDSAGEVLQIRVNGTTGGVVTNTAPTAANNTVTTAEDRPYTFAADDFGFMDADAGAALASVKIVTLPALGTLALAGTAVLADGVVVWDDIEDDKLTFTPARDAHGGPYATFTFTVNDGTDDSASAYTMTIDVTDAPAPVCTAPSYGDRREIWTGTVTVERLVSAGLVFYGFDEVLSAGTLLPSQSFSIGSSNYVIDSIVVDSSGSLHFSLDGNSEMTSKEGGALRLHVCDGDYDFITSFSSENTTTWLATTLDWSDPVVTRTVYLSLPANNPATGEPTITGTAQVGQVLTADASPIMDDDGLTGVDFTYQWLRVDADGTSNEEDISGEIAATYTLTDDDVGKKVKVKVNFTDNLSGEEERTSAATATVTAAPTAPMVTDVDVTSMPASGDTYGTGERIQYTVTFDQAVTVTGAPEFEFCLGSSATVSCSVGTPPLALRSAALLSGSGTTMLVFSYTVLVGDVDDNGIYAGNQNETIKLDGGGTIQGTVGGLTAVLTHDAVGTPTGHKVNGAAANTAPTAANNTVTAVAGTAYAFEADDFGFMDADAGAALASVKIESLPAVGTLALAGTAVTLNEVVTKAQIDDGDLTFTPVDGASGTGYATFTFKVNDGTVDSASAYTMTIDARDLSCAVPDFAGDNRRELWTGIVTAGDVRSVGYGFHSEESQTGLNDTTFAIGRNSYTVDAAFVLSVSFVGRLSFSLAGDVQDDNLTAGEVAALRLHICDTVFYDFSAATLSGNNNTYSWAGSLDWSPPVATRTLYLSLPANRDAMGEPAITGTAQVGQDLTADVAGITDADGLTGDLSTLIDNIDGLGGVEYSYQWIWVDADGSSNEEDISGEIAATYTLTDADVGKKVKVKVSFTDDLSGEEDRTSAAYPASGTVTAAASTNTAPTGADKTVTIGSDTEYAFDAEDFGFTDADTDDALASVRIETVPELGALALGSSAVMGDDVVTRAQIDGDMLTFTPAPGASGDDYASFIFTVNDGTDFSATINRITFNVRDLSCAAPDFAGDNRRELWTGIVTVGDVRSVGYGFHSDLSQTELDDTTFAIGLNSYTVDTAFVLSSTSSAGRLSFSLTGGSLLNGLTAGEVAALRLHVCDTTVYDFSATSEFTADTNTYRWDGSLDWSPPVATRTLYLSLPANRDAMGEPAITGTAQVGQELTADVAGVTDADGLTGDLSIVIDNSNPSGVEYSYQWLRVDADGSSNEEDISGEIAATYTLTDADMGKKVKVKVSFTDDLNGEEERTSAAFPSSGTVTVAGTNNAPVFSSSNVSRSIAENTAAGVNVGAAVTATDADAGDTLSYTLGGADVASFDFVETTGQIRTKAGVSYDHEAKSSYTVTVTASDGTSTAAASVTIRISDVDEPPSAPATPSISAVSGSSTSLSVSWAAPANAGEPAIDNYDVQYRAGTSGAWTDGPQDVTGTTATITSLATDTAYQARVRATNAEGDSGWSSPPGSGRTSAPGTSAPGAPRDLRTTPGDGRVTLVWTAPGSDGGEAIEKYRYRVSANAGSIWDPDWTDVPDGADAGDSAADETTFTVSGLNNGTEYVFQLRAVNSVGEGPAASDAAIPVRAPLPPGSGFLVGNFGQRADGSAQLFVTQDIVGVFTTGARGADLHNIELRLFTRRPNIAVLPIPSVTLYRASVTDSRATRGARVAALTAVAGSPQPANTAQTVAFAAPSGTRLDAGATYLVVLEHTSYVRVESTTFPAEDAGGAPGWAIDGIGAGNSSPYSYETTASLLMRVNGTAVGAAVDTAPDAPASLGARAGDAEVTLRWTPPRSDGGAGIEKYQYRYSAGSRVDPDTAWTGVPDGSDSGTSRADERSVSVTELDNGRQYAFDLRAVNSVRAGAAATATATPAAARRTGFLVSNFGQPVDGSSQISVTQDIVGAFTAGALGGTLDSIEFRLYSKTPDIAQLPSATLYRGSVTATRATPGTRVATLTAAPGSPRPAASARTIVFTAPGGTRLDAGATYLVVLAGSGFVRVESTNSSAQDAGGASGWTIDGVGAGNSSPYSYGTSDSLLMSVNGTTARAQRAVREKVAKDEQQEEEQEPATSPDPDRGISLSTSSSSAIEGEAVTISVRRAGPTDRATTVTVQVLDSALDGAWPMDLVFRSGAATATAAVAIGFDGARPASRTVTVSLASVKEPYSVGSPSTLTFNVTDRDAALSVADASVSEGPGARLAFAVTLDRTRDRKVLVRYATADGTATQGEDYTGVSGTLRFAPGETTKTVSVPVLDDAHDEGSETLTLTLSSPRRAVIDDGTAVGTIVNSDPLPNAWLSRFGRAASDHVVQSIGRRLEGGARESHLTVMGWRVDTLLQSTHPERDGREPRADAPGRQPEGSVRASEGWTGGATRGGGAMSDPGAARPAFDGAMTQGVPPMQGGALQSSARAVGASDNRWLDMLGRLFMALGPNGGEALATPGLRDMVMGSSFYYGYSPDAGTLRGMNRLTAWGESAATRFSGAEGKLSLDGEVNTAIVGADGEWGRWLAGLALSYSEGEGGYRRVSAKGGAVSSTLAGINPYARYRLDERTSFWATLGYGSGRLILTPDGAESALETDITNAMAAFGGRGVLSMRAGKTGQFELALRSDAMLTDTASIAVPGLSAGAGATSRIRLILEGSGSLPAFGGVLAPKVEAGLRYDGGDAETGAGLEVGGGLAYGKARLTVQVDGRVLLTHRDRDYEEWGYSLSLVYQPSEDGRGLRYQAGSQWGATQSGVQSLWSLQNAGGLVNGARTADGQRYTAELGYGFGVVGRLWYPYVATESGGASSQALRFGLKFNAGSALEAGLEIGRRAHLPGEMENDIQLRWQARW